MQSLLLDSHSLYWFAEDDPQMPEAIKTLIEDENKETFVSVVSVWELAIKYENSKLGLALPPEIYFADVIRENGFQILGVIFEQVVLAAKLPKHHKAPFDRLLIAQSLTENFPILSTDEIFDDYGVIRIW